MGNRIWCLSVLVALVICCSLVAAVGGREEEGRRRKIGENWFVLRNSKQVVKTDAGNMKIVRSFGGKFMRNPMHLGFITMEPRSLFIPQYLDSSLILFIRTGEARVGHIYKDELVERDMKMGDVYRIDAGSAFYLINTAEEERLHVICSIDTSESLGWHAIQSFFIAGGTYPTSVLAGFDHPTLASAFNVSEEELGKLLSKQQHGPIVFWSDSHSPSVWSKFLDMEHHQKLAHMRRIVRTRTEDPQEKEEEQPTWSFRKFLFSVFGKAERREDRRSKMGQGPDCYNIYEKKPDFQNNYGWSTALDESDYSPLMHDDLSIYLVNLSAGSMMAPHINPRAIEYGIVLRGAGRIQIVYPNGSLAMNAKVTEGDVFWIPRYFPFCQIASRHSPFEFFGFTTSARNNRPQFLAGANSLLHAMRGPEFEAAFGVSKDRLEEIINAQRESVILPSSVSVAPPEEVDGGETAEVMRSLRNEMVMQFD